MPEWIGKTVGKVRIEREIAKGGMAEVYLGTHLTLDRPVAVKVMHNFIEADPDLQSRFEREAKVVAALRHPNIIQIFDYDTADGHPYIVMEYLKGPSLATYLRELHSQNDRLTPKQVARLLVALAAGLDYAHEQGVIHRDIKPGNILLHNKAREISTEDPLTGHTEPVITDFGLVRIAHSATQTASGVVSGTPAYMSPEQAQGTKVDHRSDIYSLGVVLYEMLAGRVPFEADTSWTVILKHIKDPPPQIEGIQPPVQGVVERVLAKDPEMRYQTCRELAADYLNAIGMISESATMRMASVPAIQTLQSDSAIRATPGPVSASEKRDQPSVSAWRGILPIAGITAALILAIAALGFSLFRPSGSSTDLPSATAPSLITPPSTSVTNVVPPVAETNPVGLLRFQDGTAPADGVTISTTGMTLPPEGNQYEAWLIADDGEQRVSLGVIDFAAEGTGSLNFIDNEGRNLLGIYHAMEITVEPNPDNSPNPSNTIAFSALLPEEGLIHVRHLLVSFAAAPNKIGLVRGLDADTRLVNDLAEAMLRSFESGDEADVRLQAESMLNIIVGSQSEEHKDWNGNGTVEDPGDGFGLLLNGNNVGYIQGTFSHADLARTAPDATPNMLTHGEHVKVAATNVGNWTPQLRDQLKTILESASGTDLEGPVRQAVALANQVRNGIDINGNETVEPIPDEGGALTAYEHAYYMADMSIFPNTDQSITP
jgi:serine/threonine-protein kinase